MFVRDRTKSGDACLRHENFKSQVGYTLGNRRVEYANAIIAVDKYGHPIHRDSGRDTVGDIQGGTFIKAKDRAIGSWWHGCPVKKKGSGFKPIRDREFNVDDAYELIDAAVKDGAEVPEDAIGIVYAASKEDGEQELIFIPSNFGQKLLAPNRNGPYTQGTDVHDLDAGGKADQKNYAKLQSAWIPMTPSYSPSSGSGGSPNFFFGAAVGIFGGPPGGINLIPAQDDNGDVINIGFSDDPVIEFGSPNDEGGGIVSVGPSDGPGVGFSSPNDEGGGIVDVGVGFSQNGLDITT